MFINDLFNNKSVNEDWKEFKSRAGEVAKKTADTIVSAGTATRDAVGAALDTIPRPFDEKTYQDYERKPIPKTDWKVQDPKLKPKEIEETSAQDQLHQRHQEIRKQSGKPHPDYYKELRATFDLPDDERWAKTAELKKKYNVKESLRPGERHHFETDPKTGKRVYKGIRGDQQDAPRKRDNSGDAGERADRERRAHIQHDRRMTEHDVEETYGAQLHTKHKKNRFKQIKQIKNQKKPFRLKDLDEAGCNMTAEGRQCSVHGLAECPGYGMTEGSTNDPRFQKMMGNIQKSTPTLVTGYVALEFASERKSNKIKGVTRNGKPIPDVINNPEEELGGKIEFTPDQIEQQLMSIGRKYGWDSIDPGQGRGYTELFFETTKEYTSDTQNLLATNILKTVNAINKFFNSINSSLQATGLPGYTTSVWQGMGPSDDINKITNLRQISKIATDIKRSTKNTGTSDDVGVKLGNAILAHYKEFGPDGGYSKASLNLAAKIGKIYITQGERAGLEAQMKAGSVSEMIDELLSDAGLSGERTIWELDEFAPSSGGVAEGINEDIERYVEALSRAGYEVTEEKVRLDPKCWKGKKIGSPKTKMKGGVRVNNCVPK